MMRYVLVPALVAACATVAAAGQLVSDHDRREALQHYTTGEKALQQESFDTAEQEFQTAAKLDPTLDLAYYGLGQVDMATKQYPDAVRDYVKCRDLFNASASAALTNQTKAQQQLDDQIRALEDERNALNSGRVKSVMVGEEQRLESQINQLKSQRHRQDDTPAGVPAWISLPLGSAYFRTNAMDDAEREFRAALADSPKLGEAHNNLAIVLMLTHRYDEAEDEIKAAEQSGFQVNPQFKADLKKARGR